MKQQFEQLTTVLARSLGLNQIDLVQGFQRAVVADLEAICELRRLGFGSRDELDKKVINWLYFDFSKNSSDIFILRIRDQLIASIGVEPITLAAAGQNIEGVRAGDIVVHPDYMQRGIGGWMNLYLQHHYDLVMVMGANRNSRSMMRRLYQPTNCRYYFKYLFSCKNYLIRNGWPVAIASFVNIFLWLPYQHMRLLPQRKFDSSFETNCRAKLADLTDLFDSRARDPQEGKSFQRSLEFYKWRFDLNPKSKFSYIQVKKSGITIACAVIKVDKLKENGDCFIMDWFFAVGFKTTDNFKRLMRCVMDTARQLGANSISVLASDDFAVRSLHKSVFSLRAKDDGLYLFLKKNILQSLLEEKDWFISYADTDEVL